MSSCSERRWIYGNDDSIDSSLFLSAAVDVYYKLA